MEGFAGMYERTHFVRAKIDGSHDHNMQPIGVVLQTLRLDGPVAQLCKPNRHGAVEELNLFAVVVRGAFLSCWLRALFFAADALRVDAITETFAEMKARESATIAKMLQKLEPM